MKRIILILSVIFIYSCERESKTPEYIIPPDKMVNIITDIHITDGLFTLNNVRRRLAKDSVNYYESIFYNYGFSRSDFDSSINYYSENIDVYDKIYEEVLNKLNEKETLLKQEEAIYEERKQEREKKKQEEAIQEKKRLDIEKELNERKKEEKRRKKKNSQ